MNKRISTVLGGMALVALGVAGCSDDPALFLSGPGGPLSSIQLTTNRVNLNAGTSITVGAQSRDAAGNAVAQAVSIAACDADVSVADAGSNDQWSVLATVTANAIGESCVTATAGTITETIRVIMGPASIKIAGPDTLGSGESSAYELQFFDAAGTAITPQAEYEIPVVESLDENNLTAEEGATAKDYTVAAVLPGSGTLRAEASNGANDDLSVLVVAGAFGGSLSVASGAAGAFVIASKAAGGPDFDANTNVQVDGVDSPSLELLSSDQIGFAVPITTTAGAVFVTFVGLGDQDLVKIISFDITTVTTDNWAPGSADGIGAPDYDAIASPAGNVFFTFEGQGAIYGGASPDDWFAISAGATDRTVTVTFTWSPDPGADADLFICSLTGGAAGCGTVIASQDYNPPNPTMEQVMVTIPANTTYYIVAVNFSDQGATGPFYGQINVQ